MSVSLRVTGTWAELTADGTVAIPATPQVGDRMYLFARWKDFSITATVADWTELVEFADGAVSAGNGTGSVKVACWYRDWQPGDSDPTIDFSANPENASVVITVMQKGADDVWDTPVARTAAMTNWTTTSQSVSASATVDVRSGGVVMGLIGIRDDSATMTRPTNGIDDDAAAVTWNGNYVESPATHHSTTTGFDGAADSGYRLVTTGAAGATLRMTGTISAAETGAALWVVQGVSVVVTPGIATLITSTFAPLLKLLITPAAIALTTTSFAPQLRLVVTPTPALLTTTTFAPSLQTRITPATATLTITTFAPQLHETLIPATATVSLTTFAPTLQTGVTPGVAALTLTTFAPSLTQNLLIEIPTANLTITTSRPHVRPFRFTFLDPGGDAVHTAGYFHTNVVGSGSDITYDPTVQVAGVGSYRFDSNTNEDPKAEIPDVLGAAGRVSFYWRADSVPDKIENETRFVTGTAPYSSGGFDFQGNNSTLSADNEVYAIATAARNDGQGSVFADLTFNVAIPIGAVIDLVKIIYERKYDIDTSIGISRVKWRVSGEEGPNHDNTDMPLTDTVVEVDVTGDRAWEWQDLLDGVFEVIAEARRGDTDTEHTQSWDYVKVEVEYHLATAIAAPPKAGGGFGFQIAITPKGAHSVVRFVDGAGVGYDGITHLEVDTQNQISFSYVVHDTDDLDIKVYVNQIEELSIEQASTGGVTVSSDLHYGWLITPGIDHRAWFSHLAIDEGDDLTDIGNVLSTAKRSAAVNEDNWNTVGGTGAVNERPLSETNYIAQLESFTRTRQTYTLEEADEGDVDLSGKTLVGHMGWAWAKVSAVSDAIDLIVNNEEVDRTAQITNVPSLLRHAVTSSNYPSHAAGIGMRSMGEVVDNFMYEGGLIQAYVGPPNPDILLERQEVANETLDTIVDDLRSESITSYELCCNVQEFDGSATIDVYSIDSEGNSPQFQGTMSSSGGVGRMRITPGIEVQVVVSVVGVTMMQVYRRVNFE